MSEQPFILTAPNEPHLILYLESKQPQLTQSWDQIIETGLDRLTADEKFQSAVLPSRRIPANQLASNTVRFMRPTMDHPLTPTQPHSRVAIRLDSATPPEANIMTICQQIQDRSSDLFNCEALCIPNAVLYSTLDKIHDLGGIIGPAPHGIVGGGPGAWPVPCEMPKAFPWIVRTEPSTPTSTIEKTLVIVLDTEPDPDWLAQLEPADLGELNDIDSWLRIISHEHLTCITLEDVQTEMIKSGNLQAQNMTNNTKDMWQKHSSFMGAHGIFVASIIRQSAPEADIALIPVLNSQGFGTIDALFKTIEALDSLLTSANTQQFKCPLSPLDSYKRIIINFSGFAIVSNSAGESLMQGFMQELRRDIRKERKITDPNIAADITWVAAAGNTRSSRNKNIVYPAKWPANITEVIGVAALNSEQQLAQYSHEPDSEGVCIWGGDINRCNERQASETHGILGIFYPKKFFIPNPNYDTPEAKEDTAAKATGWARWSGTSFATAVYSGLLAAGAETVSKQASPQTIYVSEKYSSDPV